MAAGETFERLLDIAERDLRFLALPQPVIASRLKLMYMKYRLQLAGLMHRPISSAFRALGRTYHVSSHTDGALLQRVLLDAHAALEALGLLGAGGVHAVDVGAHNGETILAWSLFMDGPVITAFEPDAVSYRNALLNTAGLPVTLCPVGLSDRAGRGRLNLAGGHGGEATYADPEAARGGVDTDVARGDELLAGQRIDLIKIDVEGFELHVLEGLRATLARCRFLIIEVSLQRRKDHSFHELAEILSEARFELVAVGRSHVVQGRQTAVDLCFRRSG